MRRLRSLPPVAAVLLPLAVLAIFGRWLTPFDPLAQDAAGAFAQPGAGHLLGTDYLGRDTLSRLIAGTGPSLLGALGAVAIGLSGALAGMVSAFLRRPAEFALLRTVDALMTIPPIIFAIAVIGAFGNGLAPAIVAIGILLVPRFFRIVRAETLGHAGAQYVQAAELFGASRTWIVRTHVWRKVAPTVAVTAATSAAGAVLAISALSFLGLGVPAPAPSWGSMLSSDLTYIWQDSWAALWPGLAIVVTVWALNGLADTLRPGARPQPAVVAERSAPAAEPQPLAAGVAEAQRV